MAAAVRRTDPSVVERLFESPWEFDFFQAIRLLAFMHPEPRVISGFKQPFDEAIRFRANTSLFFPASSIQTVQAPAQTLPRVDMTVNFMGLTGPQGVLPTFYTEYLIARGQASDGAAAAFFDLFNHRMISLFYLAWEKHHFPFAYERECLEQTGSRRFTHYLLDLIGMGTAHLSDQLPIEESVLLGYAGLIAQRPHSAVALQGLLRDYFQVPVEIEQFQGKWCPLEDENLAYLEGDSVQNQLGLGAIVGEQVWNQQARIRIRVGPLNWDRYQSFLPSGSAFRPLLDLVRYFLNGAWEFEVQLVLQAGEVQECCVVDDPGSPRLGESTWLKTAPFVDDPRDFAITAAAFGD